MLRYGWEIYQFLLKGFAQANKRFPNPQEIKFLENTALRIREKLMGAGVDLEKLSPEDAIQLYSNPPKLPVKPKSKPAGIEALPLQDPKLREQALKNKLEAQNMQSRERLLEKKNLEIEDPEDMFADGGRVGLMAGGILKGKKILDALKKASKTKTKAKYKKGDPITSENFGETGLAPDTTDLEKAKKIKTKGQFTAAEAIITRLKNTIRDADKMGMDPSEVKYVKNTFPNFIKELEKNPKLAENENVWNQLMSDLPGNQRFIKYDDGTVDFQIKKPSHTFKLREDLDTDRKGPIAPNDDSNMFDNMFDKMFSEYEYDQFIKSGRKPNADGGLITMFMRK